MISEKKNKGSISSAMSNVKQKQSQPDIPPFTKLKLHPHHSIGQAHLNFKMEQSQKLRIQSFNKNINSPQIASTSLKLLGGGGCGSSSKASNSIQKKAKKAEMKQFRVSQINQQFEDEFNEKISVSHLKQVIDTEQQEKEITCLLSKLSVEYKSQIFRDIEQYRIHIIETLNLILKYIVSAIVRCQNNLFDQIESQITSFKEEILHLSYNYKCIDIVFFISFLQGILSQRGRLQEYSEPQKVQISKFVGECIKHQTRAETGTTETQFSSLIHAVKRISDHDNQSLFDSIKSMVEINPEQNGQKERTASIFKANYNSHISQVYQNLLRIWFKKIEEFEKRKEVRIEDKIEFFIERLFELRQQKNMNDLILFVLIQINYLFEKGFTHQNTSVVDSKFFDDLTLKIPLSKGRIKDFIHILQNKTTEKEISNDSQVFLNFSVTDVIFRFLAVSILQKYRLTALKTGDKEEVAFYCNHLCCLGLSERNPQVKIAFTKSETFFQFINERLKENPDLFNKIIEIQSQREKQLTSMGVSKEALKNLEDFIQNEEEFNRKLNNRLIEKWQAEVRQIQQDQIFAKTDCITEIQELYMSQSLQFISGSNFFIDKSSSNNCQTKKIEALEDVISLYLRQFKQKNEQKSNNNKSNLSHILAIFAEGGGGKSMLLKKIETLLIEGINSIDPKFENLDYIPLYVQCSGLDFAKPSIDHYLQAQGLEFNQIQLIKNCNHYKVLLVDGFDQYQGKFFRLFSEFQLYDWNNTLVIVTSRREQFNDYEILNYFSLDNDLCCRDDSSYTFVQLYPFERKDIHEYCERYFKLQMKNDNEKIQNKMQMATEILNANKNLTKQILIPSNLFMFARLIELLESPFEVQIIKEVKQMGVSIEDMFFQKLFRKQAKTIYEELNFQFTNKDFVIDLIKNSYFSYFESIAIQMLSNKGKVPNYLEADKMVIEYYLGEDLQEMIDKDKQQDVYNKICSYHNPVIIVDTQRIQLNNQVNVTNTYTHLFKKLSINPEKMQLHSALRVNSNQLAFILKQQTSAFQQSYASSINMSQVALQKKNTIQYNVQTKLETNFSFRNKCIFEYFAARAMKSDFHQYKERIHSLSIDQLSKFRINQKLLFQSTDRGSEKQILLKFYQFIKRQIDTVTFLNTYNTEEIQKSHSLIQYIKRSKIIKKTDEAPLDVGSSNLLTALFLSNFQYPSLDLNQCSFSNAYLPQKKHPQINFQKANLSHAYLKGSNINFEHACTTDAFIDLFQLDYNFKDAFTFISAFWNESNQFFTMSSTGYLNCFQLEGVDMKLVKSNKIGFDHYSHFLALNEIHNISLENNLYQISQKSLEIIKCHTFNKNIKQISSSDINKILVILEDNSIYIGDIYEGFERLGDLTADSAFISQNGYQLLLIKDSKELIMYDIMDFKNGIQEMEKITFESGVQSILLTNNSRYIAFNLEDQTCIIRSTNNRFKELTKLDHHILQIASSEDGQVVAYTKTKDRCQIYTFTFGSLYIANTFECQPDESFEQFSFNNNGTYFSAVLNTNTCKIWDLSESAYVSHSIECSKSINKIAFSQDNTQMAMLSQNNFCKVMKISQKTEHKYHQIWKLKDMKDTVDQMVFCHLNLYLAISFTNGQINIYQSDHQIEFSTTVNVHDSSITSMEFTPDGKSFVVVYGCSLKLLNVVKSFSLSRQIDTVDHVQIRSLAVSSCSQYIALGLENNGLAIYHYNNKNQLEHQKTLFGHSSCITQIIFSQNGETIITSSKDFTFKVWNKSKDYQLLKEIKIGDNILINQLQLTSDSLYLITLSSDNITRVWSMQQDFMILREFHHTSQVNCISLTTDNKYLATAYGDGYFKLEKTGFEFESVQPLVKNNQRSIKVAAFSSDGKYLAAGSSDDSDCFIYLQQKGFELYQQLKGHTQPVSSVIFSNNMKYFVTCSSDNSIRVWDVSTDFEPVKIISTHQNTVKQISFSPDSKYLLVSYKENMTCKILNTEMDFELIGTLENPPSSIINCLSFSNSGKHLATSSSSDNFLKIWSVDKTNNFKLIAQQTGHTKQINCITFSSDEKYCATSSSDKTIRIWDMNNSFNLLMTVNTEQKIKSILFSGNSDYLIGCEEERFILVWKANPSFTLVNKFSCSELAINQILITNDSKYLLTCTQDVEQSCKIWNIQNGFSLINVFLQQKNVMISENNQFIQTTNDDQNFNIYHIKKGYQLVVSEKEDIKAKLSFKTIEDKFQFICNSESLFQLYYTLP